MASITSKYPQIFSGALSAYMAAKFAEAEDTPKQLLRLHLISLMHFML
jgi:hypothetical protein